MGALKLLTDRKRIAPRYEFLKEELTPIKVSHAKAGESAVGYVKNLSWSGMCFHSVLSENEKQKFIDTAKQSKLSIEPTSVYNIKELKLKIGDNVKIEVAPLGNQPMTLRGTVIRLEDKNEEMVLGIKFTDIPYLYMERIAREVQGALVDRTEREKEVFALEQEKRDLQKRVYALAWVTAGLALMATMSIFAL